MTTKTALPPIIKTRMAKRMIRSGAGGLTPHQECWAAKTTDGVWLFERLEIPGTPWAIIHAETRIEVDWETSLLRCRKSVANGWAQKNLERIQAHDRGEHNAERVPMCGRC
jgi:hypothetical protein